MVKAAIIGCGKIAQVRHIPEYLEHQAVNLVGFYDLNEKRAEELAEKYGGKAYGSVEELLADPQIDAVSICTANHTHAELTIKALKAGKHVLCEKPMAITLEECQRMVECAEENHRKLLIGQNQRLTRTHQIARKLIAEVRLVMYYRSRPHFSTVVRRAGVLMQEKIRGSFKRKRQPWA